MPPEPIAVMLLVTDAFEKLGVRYVVGGSLASSMYGVVRATVDVDLLADLSLAQVDPLVQTLHGEFYLDVNSIREAIQRKTSFNLIHLKTMFKVDVFIRKPRTFDQAQLDRRVKQIVSTDPERQAYVATAEDNILAKLDWYRLGGETSERQWRDIIGILRFEKERLDLSYLRQSAASLYVIDLLQRALSEAGLAYK